MAVEALAPPVMRAIRHAAKMAALQTGRVASRVHRRLRVERALPAECDVHVLFRRPLGLGDLVMLSPFVCALLRQWRRGRVALVTDYAPFLDFGPALQWIAPNRWAPDRTRTLVVSPTYTLHHLAGLARASDYLGYFLSNVAISSFSAPVQAAYEPKTQHYLERALALLRMLGLDDAVNAFPPALEEDLPASVMLPERYVCVAPYSNWPERQYPMENFVEAIDALSRALPVVLIGSADPSESAFVEAIAARISSGQVLDLSSRLNLRQSARVIRRAQLFIGNDSGPAHLACTGTPAVLCVYGCVMPQTRIPLPGSTATKVLALSAGASCDLFPCYDGYSKPRCRRSLQCLRGTSPAAVVVAALGMLN